MRPNSDSIQLGASSAFPTYFWCFGGSFSFISKPNLSPCFDDSTFFLSVEFILLFISTAMTVFQTSSSRAGTYIAVSYLLSLPCLWNPHTYSPHGPQNELLTMQIYSCHPPA